MQVTYLWSRYKTPKTTERIIQHLFCNHWVKIAHKQLRTNLDRLLLVRGRLVYADGLPVEADLVHNSSSIFGVLLADEFDEPIALMGLGDAVFGEMNVDNAAGLEHQFPD